MEKVQGYTQQMQRKRHAMPVARFLELILLMTLLGGCSTGQHAALPTVPSVDLDRYLGKWYEIARYENSFEKGCVGATARYSRKGDSIEIVNSCFDGTGQMINQATGRAYSVEGSAGSKLKVTFFWPFYGDYWILMLGENYRYSVVGEKERKYLWILARQPVLEPGDRQTILTALPELGYDPDMLYWNDAGIMEKN